jgi:hypothetical protein
MLERREAIKLICACAIAPSVVFRGSPAAAARPNLLLIHGRGQQGLDAATLKTQWLDTLNRGGAKVHKSVPPDVQAAFPFYGDILNRFSTADIPLTSDIQSRGGATDDNFLAFQAQVAEALRLQAGISDAQVDAEYGANPAPRGPLNWQWVQAILRAIDKYGPGMGQSTLEIFTRDVYIYTTKAGVRDEIDKIVADALTDQPTVVVAHSLGTVVAYNVLRNDRRALKIPLLVTVGSPLGVRSVRDQFRPLRALSGVGAWYNGCDPKDVVALYPLDASNFPVQPPAIENNRTVANHTDNHHSIDGYLDDQAVADKILTALGA